MKKVLMVATVASTIGQFNIQNIEILKDMGFEVEVACNFDDLSVWNIERIEKFKLQLDELGIVYHNVSFSRSPLNINAHIKSFKQLSDILVNSGPFECIHCHSPIAGVIARLACKGFRKKGMKVIYTAHGFHFFDGAPKINWMIFYPLEKFCARYTDCLITINQEDYQRTKNFSAKKVEYVPGIGVNVNKIKNTEADRQKMRMSLGLKDEDFVLFSVGQTSKRKNHEVILKALAKIENPRIKYMICGFGELDEYLRQLANELGIGDRIVFTGFRNDVYTLLHTVNLFVFPSLQEGLPVSLMEAMAAGLPVVCSKIRGNVDLIQDGKGGLLYAPDDVDGFAEGIKKIYGSKDLREKMRAENIKRIKDFDIEVVNEQMRRIYSDAGEA